MADNNLIATLSVGAVKVSDEEVNTRLDNLENSVDNKADKSEIPTKVSELENDSNYASETFVANKIAEAQLAGSNIDLSGYATKDELNTKANKTDIPTKSSQLTNDSGYLTSIPEEYVTETELSAKGYATETYVTNKIAEANLSGGEVDLSGYATKEELNAKANTSDIPTNTSQLTNDSGFITSIPEEYVTETELDSSLSNLDASTLNGIYFSQPMTKEEYDSIETKDENIIYIIDEDSSIISVPDYSETDAGKVLTVNNDGTSLSWLDSPSGLTTEQSTQLSSAYEHSQSVHVQSSDIPTKTSQLTNDSGFITELDSNYILTSVSGKKFKLVVSDAGELSAEAIINYANIIVNLTEITINENSNGTFAITLDSAPTDSQDVSITVDNSNVTISPDTVTFTSSNYNVEQIITVTALHDSDSYVDSNSIITISSDNVESKIVNVTIKNIDSNSSLVQDSLLSSYKAINATDNIIPDLTGNNDITLEGTPTIENGYVIFEGTDGKGGATLSGFTNNGEGDWTVQICVNLNSTIKGTLISIGSYGTYSTMGDETVSWNNIIQTNIKTISFDYHTLSIYELHPRDTDFVVSVVKSGESYSIYYDDIQKGSKAVSGAMSSYSKMTILETTEAYTRKFKALAIYNKALSEDEIINNVNVLKE